MCGDHPGFSGSTERPRSRLSPSELEPGHFLELDVAYPGRAQRLDRLVELVILGQVDTRNREFYVMSDSGTKTKIDEYIRGLATPENQERDRAARPVDRRRRCGAGMALVPATSASLC